MKNQKMEIFKNNLEEQGFSSGFVKKSIEYFNELHEEMELQEMTTIEEVIGYYAIIGSYTCDALQTEENLKNYRHDIYLLSEEDYNNILSLNIYFENIEKFEIQLLYVLHYEFYSQENEEEENL